MRVVFLDLDGVLNGIETHEPMSERVSGLFLNRVLVERLNTLAERTGAMVVLSTSWRYKADIEDCVWALCDVGFRGTAVGYTPDFRTDHEQVTTYTPRSDEIRAWLAKHPVDAFVVLDDHGDAEVDGRTVRTDTRFGLTDADVERAVRILGEPSPKVRE